MARALVLRHIVCVGFAAALLFVSAGCAAKKKAAASPPQGPAPLAAVKVSPTTTEATEAEAKPGLFTRLNPFRKKQAARAQEPEPRPAAKASPPPPPETTKLEAKPGLLTRLNPFGKREEKPAEPESSQPGKAEPQTRVQRKRGRFGRWFKRGSKPLPEATPEKLLRRTAQTAKGEASPPPFEHNGLKLSIGETSKARIIATFGKPEHIFFSEGSEEILIYRRIRKIDSLYIFLNSQGLVKDYIVTKEP